MIVVERGNKLPTVALVQKLLNENLSESLPVDGRFNAPVRQAVRDFQQTNSLATDGIVGPNTWTRLSASKSLAVIDHVDTADDYHDSPGYTGYEHDLRRVGISPIVSYDQSGGIRTISNRIQQLAAATPGRVVLLRFSTAMVAREPWR